MLRRLGFAWAGGLAILNGLFWLAQALSVVMGFIQLLVWDWIGFWQWLLVGLGFGVARFIFIDLLALRVLGRVDARLGAREDAETAAFERRTNGRLDRWEEVQDELDSILEQTPLPAGTLARLGGEMDRLASEQRHETVSGSFSKSDNAALTRLFEVERDSIRDYRIAGPVGNSRLIEERRELLEELGLDEREVDRRKRALQQVMASPRKQVDASEGQYVGTSGYEERTEARLARWDEVLDELEEILQGAEWPNRTLVRLGGDLDALANEQRHELVPDGVPEWRNVGLIRLFEVDRDLIRDYRTSGGVNSRQLVDKRWDLLERLDMDQRGLGRHRLWVSDDYTDVT